MVMQASITVRCQMCGGVSNPAAGQEYHRCRFCDSLIQLEEVSVDRILPAGTGPDSGCPACARPLQTGLIEGCRVLYCESCFGVLLRNADFATIVRERAAQRADAEPAEPRPIDPTAFERHLNCPSCSKTMDVHPYYGPGNIVVDTCADCGLIWLDHGELTRVERTSCGRSRSPVRENFGAVDSEQEFRTTSSFECDTEQRSLLQAIADLLF